MKFGIHNPSWRFGTEPDGIFDAVKAKAQWAEKHGFTWFSVMDHLIQIAMAGRRKSRSWRAGRSCRRSPR